MNSDNIELDDVAEVLAYIISQEKVMAVPPVIIPTEGVSSPRKRPRKQPRNKVYTKKNLEDAQSVSFGSEPIQPSDPFPIEKPQGCDGMGGGPGNGLGLHQPMSDLDVLAYAEMEGAI